MVLMCCQVALLNGWGMWSRWIHGISVRCPSGRRIQTWRGRPLTSHEVIVQSIAATTTRTGLSVSAALDTNT